MPSGSASHHGFCQEEAQGSKQTLDGIKSSSYGAAEQKAKTFHRLTSSQTRADIDEDRIQANGLAENPPSSLLQHVPVPHRTRQSRNQSVSEPARRENEQVRQRGSAKCQPADVTVLDDGVFELHTQQSRYKACGKYFL
eukprot:1160908-Pelagomonas_calceolata.AAC.5